MHQTTSMPALAVLDQCLEGGKALKRHTDGELNPFCVQHADNVITKEGTVHARLNGTARQNRLYFLHTGEDECLGAIGIMHVTGAMPDVEDLSGLGDGAKQRVVTALPFLLPVKADGCAFSETPGRQYRTIEVQRDAGRRLI